MTEMTFLRADRLRLTAHPTLNGDWLRERIVDDPSVLGLGDLRPADEGRLRDGRLELLLRDPASGRRFTVLVRVGPADEADLVRAIEHWTIERTRYPEHEHFAVLVAEEMPPARAERANTLGGRSRCRRCRSAPCASAAAWRCTSSPSSSTACPRARRST
jgi:hypothetical protein